MQQRAKINLLKIFNAIKEYGPMHIRGIARVTDINPITVSTLVSRLEYFFIVDRREVVPGFSTKIVSLKNPEVTIADIERYLSTIKKIRGTDNELSKKRKKVNQNINGNKNE